MDLVSLIQIALRRWLIVLPVALLTLAVAAYIQVTTPSEYTASGSVLLASPSLDASSTEPVIDLDAITLELSSEEGAEALADEGARADFSIAPLDPMTLEVVATDEEEDEAATTATMVAQRFVNQVQGAQDENAVPDSERINTRVLTTDAVAEQQDDGSFRATSVILVDDPSVGVQNPYPPAAATARVVEVAIESDDGRQRVAQATGPGIGFDVSQAQRDAAPIMDITTFGSEPQQTLAAFEHVRAAVDAELDARQARADIPTRARTTVEVLAQPQSVTDVSPPLNRAVAAVVAVGGLLALGLAFAAESHARRGQGGTGAAPPLGESVRWSRSSAPSRAGDESDVPKVPASGPR